jgi:hypothetical protein
MNVHLKEQLRLPVIVVCLFGSYGGARSDSHPGPQDFKTKGIFELVVNDSSVLRRGPSRIVTQSAFVTRAHRLIPGNSEGLEIQFFTQPITGTAAADLLKSGAQELKKSDYAALVLFLDKNNKIWQANLSYVVPGTTVARTVAWKPGGIEKVFSNYQYDGQRLLLKSNGSYSETESGKEKIWLSWNVDLNLPVFPSVK